MADRERRAVEGGVRGSTRPPKPTCDTTGASCAATWSQIDNDRGCTPLRRAVTVWRIIATLMRIYLACTVRGERGGVLAGRAICRRLQEHGHEVLTTHLLEDDVDRAEAELTEEQVYRRDLDWLSRCDLLVAEASGSSYGVGFEVGYLIGRARHTGQRVFLVFDQARRHLVSRLITGNCDEACTTFAYASIEDLTAFVDAQLGPETV
jgi:nucleoside 2-deoxyribosyltransferase